MANLTEKEKKIIWQLENIPVSGKRDSLLYACFCFALSAAVVIAFIFLVLFNDQRRLLVFSEPPILVNGVLQKENLDNLLPILVFALSFLLAVFGLVVLRISNLAGIIRKLSTGQNKLGITAPGSAVTENQSGGGEIHATEKEFIDSYRRNKKQLTWGGWFAIIIGGTLILEFAIIVFLKRNKTSSEPLASWIYALFFAVFAQLVLLGISQLNHLKRTNRLMGIIDKLQSPDPKGKNIHP